MTLGAFGPLQQSTFPYNLPTVNGHAPYMDPGALAPPLGTSNFNFYLTNAIVWKQHPLVLPAGFARPVFPAFLKGWDPEGGAVLKRLMVKLRS